MDKFFGPYKFDYKQYILERYNLLESPARIRDIEYTKNDALLNIGEATRVKNNDRLIGDYSYSSFVFDLYESSEDDLVFYNLIDKKHPFIYLHHSVEPTTLDNLNGVISRDIWNWKSVNGLAWYWVFDYILSNCEFIISDEVHTSKGEKFWKQLLDDAASKKLKCGAIKMKTNEIVPIDKFEDYYNEDKRNYQFIIFK